MRCCGSTPGVAFLQALTSPGLENSRHQLSYCRTKVNHEFHQAALHSLAPLRAFLKRCPALCHVFPPRTILQSYPTCQTEPWGLSDWFLRHHQSGLSLLSHIPSWAQLPHGVPHVYQAPVSGPVVLSSMSAGWPCPWESHLSPAQLTAPGQVGAAAVHICTNLLWGWSPTDGPVKFVTFY